MKYTVVEKDTFWYNIAGNWHRESGPAMGRTDGIVWEYIKEDNYWYSHGKELTEDGFNSLQSQLN